MANAAPGTSFLRQKASTAAHKRDDAAHVHLVALLCVLDTGGTRHPNGATDLFDASDYNEPPYIALYPPEGGLVSSAFEAIQRAVRCPLWHTLTSRVLLQTTFHLAASSQLYATPRTSPNSPAKRLHHLVRDAYNEDPTWAPAASKVGTQYNIVSVLGSQGSGCTTLLNDAFGTQFVTMGMEAAQTTIGAQYAWSVDARAVALNMQGMTGVASSRIENKLAQFVASVSSIIMINLKQDEIVRHASQQKSMLETVCKTLLERYDAGDSLRRSVTLLYIVRDWDDSVSKESAVATITRGISEIWSRAAEEMEMPEALLADYIQLAFETLAHKKLDATAYAEQVATLSQNLQTVGPESFGAAVQTADVPLQDVFEHMKGIWRTVRGRVNVSDERRALAERMCPVFANSSLQKANRFIKEKLDPDQGGDDFKAASQQARNNALAQYDALVNVYDPEVASKHRSTLEANVNSELMQCYFIHLQGLRKIALGEFKQRLSTLQKPTFPNPPITPKELLVKMNNLQDDCLSVYRSLAESARLDAEWTFEEQVMTLNSSMDKLTAPIRQQQDAIELALKRSQEIIPRAMTPPVDVSSLLSTSMNHVRILSSALNLWGAK